MTNSRFYCVDMNHVLIIAIASQRKIVHSHSREQLIGQIFAYAKFWSIYTVQKIWGSVAMCLKGFSYAHQAAFIRSKIH